MTQIVSRLVECQHKSTNDRLHVLTDLERSIKLLPSPPRALSRISAIFAKALSSQMERGLPSDPCKRSLEKRKAKKIANKQKVQSVVICKRELQVGY